MEQYKENCYRKVELQLKRPSSEKSTASDSSGGFEWVVVALKREVVKGMA